MKPSIPPLLAGLLVLVSSLQIAPAQQESVKPGINEKFLDPDLNPEEWVERFEVESREVFHARREVVDACGIQPGMAVADVGAGTGLYTQLFAEAVGEKGWIYAVDINARFLEHIQQMAKAKEHANITTVLCPETSVSLPPNSVDVVFVCDTYHHFEYPTATLTSILEALRPGGRLIVVDFERIEGVSSEWTLNHVRAGKEVFKQEILDAGFSFAEQAKVAGLKDNYFLVFQKQAKA